MKDLGYVHRCCSALVVVIDIQTLFADTGSLTCYSYQINEKDELRSLEDPDQPFKYRVNVNDRYNEVRKEAINGK